MATALYFSVSFLVPSWCPENGKIGYKGIQKDTERFLFFGCGWESMRRKIGAGYGIRTRDFQLGKLTLYH